MRKIWIATYVDHGGTCSGKAGVLGTSFTKEEAQARVRADMEKWRDYHAGEKVIVDFDKMSACYSMPDDGRGCEWNITEDEINLED